MSGGDIPMKMKAVSRRIIATISVILFLFITFQSCAVGLGNAILSSDDASGAFGLIVGFNFLVTGIIMLFAAGSDSRVPGIICCVLLWFGYFLAKMFSGNFEDLVIWGFIAYLFGTFYLFTTVRSKKDVILVSVISLVYVLIALL